jgi:hypothetical protein
LCTDNHTLHDDAEGGNEWWGDVEGWVRL